LGSISESASVFEPERLKPIIEKLGHDERAVMSHVVEPDRTCVMDRGYAKFDLFNQIVDCGSMPNSFGTFDYRFFVSGEN